MISSRVGFGAGTILILFLSLFSLSVSACDLGPAVQSTLVPDDAIFSDQFDRLTSGYWHTDSDDLGESVVENEQMTLRVNSPNTIQYTTLRAPVFSDFRLQVDAESLDSASGTSYGVLIRMNERNEFYRFDITGDGRFMVEKANSDGSWIQYLDNWKRAESIKTGPDSWNTLRVDAVGSEMSFYVNNNLVYSLTDDDLTTGNIGLDVGAFDQPSASAAFDNLIIQYP